MAIRRGLLLRRERFVEILVQKQVTPALVSLFSTEDRVQKTTNIFLRDVVTKCLENWSWEYFFSNTDEWSSPGEHSSMFIQQILKRKNESVIYYPITVQLIQIQIHKGISHSIVDEKAWNNEVLFMNTHK